MNQFDRREGVTGWMRWGWGSQVRLGRQVGAKLWLELRFNGKKKKDSMDFHAQGRVIEFGAGE